MLAKMKHDMKSILGEDFFKEEVRCGYLISPQNKYLMAMELDLYLVFSEICEKYNLQYFLFYGGLLGAIRHNGFIPWDDDLDVAMPRKDFDFFMKVAPQELQEPYSLQSPYTYSNCFYSIPTMRNSMGTFTAKIFKDLDYNKGIPLDIFPLDLCNPDTYTEDELIIQRYIMECSTYMKRGVPNMNEKLLRDQEIYKTDTPLKSWEKIHELATEERYKNSDYYSIMVVTHDKCIWPKESFSNSINHRFETIEVKIPSGYEEILRITYGDYMKYPPVDQRGMINNQLIIDPYVSYFEYDFSKESYF